VTEQPIAQLEPQRYRLGGEQGPIVEHAGASGWRGRERWRVVEPGVWLGARWGEGTTINAPREKAEEA